MNTDGEPPTPRKATLRRERNNYSSPAPFTISISISVRWPALFLISNPVPPTGRKHPIPPPPPPTRAKPPQVKNQTHTRTGTSCKRTRQNTCTHNTRQTNREPNLAGPRQRGLITYPALGRRGGEGGGGTRDPLEKQKAGRPMRDVRGEGVTDTHQIPKKYELVNLLCSLNVSCVLVLVLSPSFNGGNTRSRRQGLPSPSHLLSFPRQQRVGEKGNRHLPCSGAAKN